MLKIAIFVVLVVSARGMIVCPPNICATINCTTPIINCKGIIKPGAGWCGCCDLCVTQLGKLIYTSVVIFLISEIPLFVN